MLIRHSPCFLLLPLVDHPVSVVLAPFVATLVSVVGLVPCPTPTRLVLAVRAPVIARAADDELVPAPPANDPSRVRSHRSSWRTQRTSYRPASRAISRPHRSARGSGHYPGPLVFVAARSPTDLPRRRRRARIHGDYPPLTSGARVPVIVAEVGPSAGGGDSSKRLWLRCSSRAARRRHRTVACYLMRRSCSSRSSSFSWCLMYLRMVSSSRPTVETKKPRAQKCWPTKLRRFSP